MRSLPIWILCGISSRGSGELNVVENVPFGDVFVGLDGREYRVKRPDPERIVCWNRNAIRRRRIGLQNNVAANLMDPSVAPNLAKMPDQSFPA